MNKPDCATCTNSQQQGQTMLCLKFNVKTTPRTSQDCTDFFQREPGSDDSPMVWFKGAWVCDAQGRGD